jgi:hypothetical protein
MIAALRPVLSTPPRPADPNSPEAVYIRSFLVLRTLVGSLGIALPLVVILVDKFVYSEGRLPRGSVSVYYYSGARDLFVAIMAAMGVFFVAYKVAETTFENTLSWLAGLGAIAIPLFPTSRPSKDLPLTPLQNLVGEHWVFIVHFLGSILFLGSLLGISVMFGYRERRRSPHQGQKLPAVFWGRYHYACAALMALAFVWIAITLNIHEPAKALLIGEWTTAWAFGASWLAKGFEIDTLLKRRPVKAGST